MEGEIASWGRNRTVGGLVLGKRSDCWREIDQSAGALEFDDRSGGYQLVVAGISGDSQGKIGLPVVDRPLERHWTVGIRSA